MSAPLNEQNVTEEGSVNTIVQERVEALEHGEVELHKGAHASFESGHCAMEVVAWLAGLGHTDAPECSSPVLTTFTISVNDQWDETQRQKLAPFLPRMVGTANDGQDEVRSYLALDWLIRSYTPAWLGLAGLTVEAQELRDLPRIVDMVSAERAGEVVRSVRPEAVAAGFAAGDATWDAAWVATWDAAWDAAWVATWDAAWDVARDAARAAARAAAGDAAGAATWDVAWDAARAALQPTVESLQASALDLLDRMIDPSKSEVSE